MTRRLLQLTATIACLAVLAAAAPAAAQERDEATRLLREAAFKDGLDKLMEKVGRVRLDTGAVVGDALKADPRLARLLPMAVRDTVQTVERAFVDGSREVDLALTGVELAHILRQCAEKYPALRHQWPETSLARLASSMAGRPLAATGAAHRRESARAILRPGAMPEAWRQVKTPGPRKARTAARRNAQEKLLARILKTPVGKRRVALKDLMGASTHKRLLDFVRTEAREVPGSLRYTPDLSCEVDLEIEARLVFQKIESIARSRIDPQLDRLMLRLLRRSLESQARLHGRKLFQATGLGFPPAAFVSQPQAAGRRPPWARDVLKAEGTGFPPDSMPSEFAARSMGFRLARDDAAGKLVDEIRGLKLLSGKTVGSLLDASRTRALEDLVKNGDIHDLGFDASQGYRVEIGVNLWRVWNLIRQWK